MEIKEFEGKKAKNKWRSSLYDITINLNKSLNTKSDSAKEIPIYKEKLKTFLISIMDKDRINKIFLNCGRVGTPKTEWKLLTKDHIKEIEVKNLIEANTQGLGFLHSHTFIKIIHDSRVCVNLDLLKKTFYKYAEPWLTGKPYINVQGRTDTAYNMENYLNAEKEEF